MAFKLRGWTPFTQLDDQPGYKKDAKRFQVHKSWAENKDRGYGASESYEFGKGGRDQDDGTSSITIRHSSPDQYMEKDHYSLTKSKVNKDGTRKEFGTKKISKSNYNIRKGWGRIKNILSGGSEETYRY